jgi:hypothetical protein
MPNVIAVPTILKSLDLESTFINISKWQIYNFTCIIIIYFWFNRVYFG